MLGGRRFGIDVRAFALVANEPLVPAGKLAATVSPSCDARTVPGIFSTSYAFLTTCSLSDILGLHPYGHGCEIGRSGACRLMAEAWPVMVTRSLDHARAPRGARTTPREAGATTALAAEADVSESGAEQSPPEVR